MAATETAHALFVEAVSKGRGERNFWSAIEVLEARAGVRIGEASE